MTTTSPYKTLHRPLRTYEQALADRKADSSLLRFLTYAAVCALPEHRKNELRREEPRIPTSPSPFWRVIV